MIFSIFFTFVKIPFLKKNWGYNRASVNSSTQKILVWHRIFYRMVRSFFNFFQNVKKMEKSYMHFENSKNWLEIKKKDRSPDYFEAIIYFLWDVAPCSSPNLVDRQIQEYWNRWNIVERNMFIRYVFATRLRTTLKKFLNNWSKRFTNTTQRFFSEGGLQRLEKNLKNFGRNKITLPVFLFNNFFLHQFVWVCLELLICQINVLSTFRIVDF